MWEVWIKIESRREALRWGKKSYEQSAWYYLWEVAHSISMEVPWPLVTWPNYPHIWLPFASEPVSSRSSQALAKNHHPSSTVRQHTPAPPVPQPQFPSFCKSQLTSPTHNLVILLPHCFYTLISWHWGRICLMSPGNRTRASVVGVRRHKHYATN